MGWNSIKIKDGSRLFKGVSDNSYVYFVHSYYLQAENENDVAATTDYITHIHASVEHGNTTGVIRQQRKGLVDICLQREYFHVWM